MSGDIYTDRTDPTTFWKLLQFGIQNLYDAEQDEWIVIDKATVKPGKVELPEECATATPPSTAASWSSRRGSSPSSRDRSSVSGAEVEHESGFHTHSIA